MSPELIAILGVGIALAALMFHILRRMEERIRQDAQRFEERMESRFASHDGRLASHDGRFTVLETRLSDIGERLAKVEGLLEGLRDAITGRQAA